MKTFQLFRLLLHHDDHRYRKSMSGNNYDTNAEFSFLWCIHKIVGGKNATANPNPSFILHEKKNQFYLHNLQSIVHHSYFHFLHG